VWFVNAGDTLAFDEAYAYVESCTSSEGFVWGFGPARVVERDGQLRGIPGQAAYTVSNHAYGRTPICHQAAVCQVAALLDVGGFDEAHYSIAADYRALLLLGRRHLPVQWAQPVVNYAAGGISDRHLLRSHWQQHRARIETLDHGFTDSARSLARFGRMSARICAGRSIDLAARIGIADPNWRRLRSHAGVRE